MKEICKQCKYWTKNKSHGNYKCYTNICPAKIRDQNLQNLIENRKEEAFRYSK